MLNKDILNDVVRKLVNERKKSLEDFIVAYFAEHPELSVDDVELVENSFLTGKGRMETSWRIRKRESEDSCSDTD